MLNRFNSNTRKLNRVIKQINLNNLSGSGYLDNLLDDYILQTSLSSSFDGRDINGNPLSSSQAMLELSASIAYNYNTSFDTSIPTKFNSNSRKLNRIIPKINPNNLVSTDLTGSLLNIEIPTNTKFQSKTRSNPNPIKLVNNKTTISEFYQEILENSARINQRTIDAFDNAANTLTIYNVTLDYGTEGASPNNFEVLVFGLHIPGNYTIKEVGSDVVITLNEQYIDYDNVTINDIYVIGKLVDVPVATEDDSIIITEDGLDIII